MIVKRQIFWSNDALNYLDDALKFIKQDSGKNAATIAKAILSSIENAAQFPERFPIDKYKKGNTNPYRAFELYSFRISFYFDEKRIEIVRIRHTKQRPLNY